MKSLRPAFASFVNDHLHGDVAGKVLELNRLPDCSLLWMNPSPAKRNWRGRGYSAGLDMVEQFGWFRTWGRGERVAFADRYGGRGIGTHGGSGRAAYFEGVHLKGIGPTDLIGDCDDGHHSSGKVFLEEALRETVFSEIIGAEFPHGAVPTISILHTGLVRPDEPPESAAPRPVVEPQVLMVRPGLLRPAHFERAAFFRKGPGIECCLDTQRVRAAYLQSTEPSGSSWLPAVLLRLASRWADQLAYGFVNRVHHFDSSSSNVDIEGALLDFGATSAVPTWADFITGTDFPTTRSGLINMVNRLSAVIADVEACTGATILKSESIGAFRRSIGKTYRRRLLVETLRLCGLRRTDARASTNTVRKFDLAWKAVMPVLRHYGAQTTDIIEGIPENLIPWDFETLYSSSPAKHLAALREFVDSTAILESRQAVIARNVFRSTSREPLYREPMRRSLFKALSEIRSTSGYDATSVSRLVARLVVDNRRDSKVELGGCSMKGAFYGDAIVGTVHYNHVTAASHLVVEAASSDRTIGIRAGAHFPIVSLRSGEIVITVGSRTVQYGGICSMQSDE